MGLLIIWLVTENNVFKGGGSQDDEKMAGDMAEEYTFFLEQYNKAKSEEDRDAANSAAHRFSLTTECKY